MFITDSVEKTLPMIPYIGFLSPSSWELWAVKHLDFTYGLATYDFWEESTLWSISLSSKLWPYPEESVVSWSFVVGDSAKLEEEIHSL